MRSPSPTDPATPAPKADGTRPAASGPGPAPGGPERPARRSFLLGSAGATAALAAAPQAAEAFETPEQQVGQRYSRTPHVERFYFLNRL